MRANAAAAAIRDVCGRFVDSSSPNLKVFRINFFYGFEAVQIKIGSSNPHPVYVGVNNNLRNLIRQHRTKNKGVWNDVETLMAFASLANQKASHY